MANADTPEDALTARKNGAQGIGLCRTEHMVIIFPSFLSLFFFSKISGKVIRDFIKKNYLKIKGLVDAVILQFPICIFLLYLLENLDI